MGSSKWCTLEVSKHKLSVIQKGMIVSSMKGKESLEGVISLKRENVSWKITSLQMKICLVSRLYNVYPL